MYEQNGCIYNKGYPLNVLISTLKNLKLELDWKLLEGETDAAQGFSRSAGAQNFWKPEF